MVAPYRTRVTTREGCRTAFCNTLAVRRALIVIGVLVLATVIYRFTQDRLLHWSWLWIGLLALVIYLPWSKAATRSKGIDVKVPALTETARKRLLYCLILLIIASQVFPLHRGDGRSESYNDGWFQVTASYLANSAKVILQQSSETDYCAKEYQTINGEYSPNNSIVGSHPRDNRQEWINGCRDALLAGRYEITNVTIPTTPFPFRK
ncbi:MAG: hypothetical protein JWM55_2112 [Acidimicrobiaceae bacterium]|nr:hypothetical protein [Acidimicrobiaceae bacterium]